MWENQIVSFCRRICGFLAVLSWVDYSMSIDLRKLQRDWWR